MKCVINTCYGCFHLPEEFQTLHEETQEQFSSMTFHEQEQILRTNPEFVSYVETVGYKTYFCRLSVVDIPDDATDWAIMDYDGLESVIAVVNGKLTYCR